MVRWTVIGVGDITRKRVLPAIMSERRSKLYGIVTRDPAKAEPYKPERVWTSLEPALSDTAVDAVYVGSPVFLHQPQTVVALRAGKHVLCEKPMAMNESEARAMNLAADESGRLLAIAYYRRLYPKVKRAAELLQGGAIGQPVLAEINCHDWFDDIDGPRGWLLDPVLAGGGPLYDIGSHRIDVLNFLFGLPVAAQGRRSNAIHRRAVEDNATVLIEYRSGVRGVVDVRWHCRNSRDEFRIIGTDGEMVLSPLNGPILVHPGGREELPVHPNLHFPCIENFVNAVLDGTPLAATGESAAWTDWVTQRVIDSEP
jgi:predicted dehydrogenase